MGTNQLHDRLSFILGDLGSSCSIHVVFLTKTIHVVLCEVSSCEQQSVVVLLRIGVENPRAAERSFLQDPW